MPIKFQGRAATDPIPAGAPQTLPEPPMDAAELMSRCRAASRLALRGKSWSTDDRDDCASHLLVWAVERNGRADRETFSREAFTFSAIAGEASNYRRSVEASRRRDADDAAKEAAGPGFRSGDPAPELRRPDGLTPDAARTAAVDMLGALGLPRLGRLFPVAYAAARCTLAVEAVRDQDGRAIGQSVLVQRDQDAADVAAELGITLAGLRKLAQRAASHVPSADVYSPDAHGSALGLEVEASPAVKATATRMHAADIGHTMRERADVDLPNVRGSALGIATATSRKARKRGEGREIKNAAELRTPPSWTVGLPKLTAARLAHGAEVRRARSATRTDAERRALRQSVGLPATVR